MKIYKVFFLSALSLLALVCFADLFLKLPYEAGEEFIIIQGYNSLPTHINKDLYALDLSQNSCDAYGKPALAVADGMVISIKSSGDYGNSVILDHGNNIESIYAHLIKDSFFVKKGEKVITGQLLGRIGSTGKVFGTACLEHPGTHLHFAIY